MQTPKRFMLEGFYQARAVFLRDQCVTNAATGRVLCRGCGGRIKAVPATIEIHELADGQCRGQGEQFEAGVPYCPCCEDLPAMTGCVHA